MTSRKRPRDNDDNPTNPWRQKRDAAGTFNLNLALANLLKESESHEKSQKQKKSETDALVGDDSDIKEAKMVAYETSRANEKQMSKKKKAVMKAKHSTPDATLNDCRKSFPDPAKTGTFDVIYCDPPWNYQFRGSNGMAKYPTLTIQQLSDLPVASLASKDCALFMWVVGPRLADATRLMKAWGFDYVTVYLVWTKRNKNGTPVNGLGYYTRSSCEFLLLGKRGSILKYKTSNSVPQEFDTTTSKQYASVRGEHSEKPDGIRDLIAAHFDVRNRIELFARKTCPGWHAWGLDIEGFVHVPVEPGSESGTDSDSDSGSESGSESDSESSKSKGKKNKKHKSS